MVACVVNLCVVLLVLFVVRLALLYWQLLFPMFNHNAELHENLVKPGDPMVARIWLSQQQSAAEVPYMEEFHFTYDQSVPDLSATFNVSLTANALEKGELPLLNVVMAHNLPNNKSKPGRRAVYSLVKPIRRPPARSTSNLFTGRACSIDLEPAYNGSEMYAARGVPHMHLSLVYDTMNYPKEVKRTSPWFPDIAIDDVGVADDELVKLNAIGSSMFRTKVSIGTISAARHRFQQVLSASFAQNEQLLGDEGMMQMRDLFANTHPFLLLSTVIVSLLHLIFEFLAVKHDVLFFQACDPADLTKYVSVQSIAVEILMQTLVLLYLLDEGSNLVVCVTCAVAIPVDVWKVCRIMRPSLVWLFGLLPVPCFERKLKLDAHLDFESVAMNYLTLALSPFVLLYCIYTFTHDCHRGWVSFCLHSAATCVYSIGFVMMTPQVFMNYKHKSVEYMPWRKLAYRATTTFIDDLFALIIRMPTLHRLSCFRDDVIFFVYLIQRWLYTGRQNSFGTVTNAHVQRLDMAGNNWHCSERH